MRILVLAVFAVTVSGCASAKLVTYSSTNPRSGIVAYQKDASNFGYTSNRNKAFDLMRSFCASDYQIVEQSNRSILSPDGANIDAENEKEMLIKFQCKPLPQMTADSPARPLVN